jgi:hypothetical protein
VARTSYLALAMLVLLSSPAFGQYVAVVQGCSRDAKQLCATAQAGGDQLAECIKANFPALGEPCKAALVRVAGVRKSCEADVRTQCPGIKPGAGRLLLCVKQHFAALSQPCKDALGRAAERKSASR